MNGRSSRAAGSSFMDSMNTSMAPAKRPRLTRGRCTRRSMPPVPCPRERAAMSRLGEILPMLLSTEPMAMATKRTR
ncbi:hypothetical protein D3C80_1481720 [compost metagenome]